MKVFRRNRLVSAYILNMYTLYCIFRLLFHNSRYPCAVYKSNLEGKELTTIVSTDLVEMFGLDLDFLNKRLYWADHGK